jgi:hypothetical protein
MASLDRQMSKRDRSSAFPAYAFESFRDPGPSLAKLTSLTAEWDARPSPFGTTPRLTLADAAVLSYPLRSAVSAVVGSHFASRSPRRVAEAAADLGYKLYNLAAAATGAGLSCCVTQSFNGDAAARACAPVHSLEFECPAALAVGCAPQRPTVLQKLFQWWNHETYRLPIESIRAAGEPLPPELLPAVEAVRSCFSLGNAQNWQLEWRKPSVHFFVTSELYVRFVNGGMALAAFELAAAKVGLRGAFEVDEKRARDDPEYLVSWKAPTGLRE